MTEAFKARLSGLMVAALTCLGGCPCAAQTASEGIGSGGSTAQFSLAVLSCLKQSKYVVQAHLAQAEVDGDDLKVSLYQDPRASIADLKINSILLTKELIECFPNLFDNCIFAYYRVAAQNYFTEVAVAKRDVRLFAAKKLSNSQILSRVVLEPFLSNGLKSRYHALSYAEILNYCSSKEHREMRERILSLKANGYDVSGAERQYLKMEDLARNKDYSAYDQALSDCELSLQEVLVNGSKPGKIRIANERNLWPR